MVDTTFVAPGLPEAVRLVAAAEFAAEVTERRAVTFAARGGGFAAGLRRAGSDSVFVLVFLAVGISSSEAFLFRVLAGCLLARDGMCDFGASLSVFILFSLVV